MLTGRVIEDGFSFLLLVAVLAFLWFHRGYHRRLGGKGNTPAIQQKKAA